MKQSRIPQLIEWLRAGEVLRCEEVARRFGVSQATIRRDFEALAAAKEAYRFHGGIRAAESRDDPALPIAMRQGWDAEIKLRLARHVAGQLPETGAIFVDGGTTTAYLGRFLPRPGLRIITNSLALLDTMEAAGEKGPTLALTGGVYNRKSKILLGPEAEAAIRRFHADVAVVSGSALDEEALYDNREDAAALQRLMAANADRLIVMTTAAKLGRKALCRSFDADRISLLVTEFCPEKHPVIAGLRARGVQVAVLPAPPEG